LFHRQRVAVEDQAECSVVEVAANSRLVFRQYDVPHAHALHLKRVTYKVPFHHCLSKEKVSDYLFYNKKHLKNVGPIRHNEPPHAHSADVASAIVACRLRIDVYDANNDDENDNA